MYLHYAFHLVTFTSKVDHDCSYLRLFSTTFSILSTTSSRWCWVLNIYPDDHPLYMKDNLQVFLFTRWDTPPYSFFPSRHHYSTLSYLLCNVSQNFIYEAQDNGPLALSTILVLSTCDMVVTITSFPFYAFAHFCIDEFLDIKLGINGARLMICSDWSMVGTNYCEFGQNSPQYFDVWSKIKNNQNQSNPAKTYNKTR